MIYANLNLLGLISAHSTYMLLPLFFLCSVHTFHFSTDGRALYARLARVQPRISCAYLGRDVAHMCKKPNRWPCSGSPIHFSRKKNVNYIHTIQVSSKFKFWQNKPRSENTSIDSGQDLTKKPQYTTNSKFSNMVHKNLLIYLYFLFETCAL